MKERRTGAAPHLAGSSLLAQTPFARSEFKRTGHPAVVIIRMARRGGVTGRSTNSWGSECRVAVGPLAGIPVFPAAGQPGSTLIVSWPVVKTENAFSCILASIRKRDRDDRPAGIRSGPSSVIRLEQGPA